MLKRKRADLSFTFSHPRLLKIHSDPRYSYLPSFLDLVTPGLCLPLSRPSSRVHRNYLTGLRRRSPSRPKSNYFLPFLNLHHNPRLILRDHTAIRQYIDRSIISPIHHIASIWPKSQCQRSRLRASMATLLWTPMTRMPLLRPPIPRTSPSSTMSRISMSNTLCRTHGLYGSPSHPAER
jgi:hypothetical protein